jgi:hypothetical protein
MLGTLIGDIIGDIIGSVYEFKTAYQPANRTNN